MATINGFLRKYLSERGYAEGMPPTAGEYDVAVVHPDSSLQQLTAWYGQDRDGWMVWLIPVVEDGLRAIWWKERVA